MDLFDVQTVQLIAEVLSVAIVLLGAGAMMRMLLGSAAVISLLPAARLHRTPVAASAAAIKVRPLDASLANLPARAPPFLIHGPDTLRLVASAIE